MRILKVPHHGSLTSSTWEFVRAARPNVAVVSAGRSNHFGHPVPEVLERYRSVGAEVFRTDADGAVMVDSDGYGARQGQTPIERLIEDCRTLSPAGIERIAAGWDARHHHETFQDAEKAALHAIEARGRTTE